jgi:predicted ATP-dependent endonuclease of OLD family
MYLKECLLENVGPIEFLDLTLPFNEDGTPQPLVLVGVNGSGKSIFLSYIVDALTEFAKIAYRDIVSGQKSSMYSPYFKIVGSLNQRVQSNFGIGLLQFLNKDTVYSYVDKTGNLDSTTYSEKIRGRFEGVQSWSQIEDYKLVAPKDKKAFENLFRENSICYFPPSRKEFPHWLNRSSLEQEVRFVVEQEITGELGKPIFVESSVQENKSWILNVFLDSLIDFDLVENQLVVPTSNIVEKRLLKQARINIETLLQQVLQDDSAMLTLNYRNANYSRLCVAKENRIAIPSLDHLSSGQSILFNMFTTIIRYADKGNINKSIVLTDIEGIVVIDEIDAHLHTDLQYEILPKLLKLFPKVQFILTSHSPLFLLGMERDYGSHGFKIIEMPDGTPISTERFSEFKISLDYYQKTKAFEDEVQNRLLKSTKPVALVEGETDLIYIKAAIKLLGCSDIFEQIDINWVGAWKGSQTFNAGATGLNNTSNVFEANPELLKHQLLLLYDSDTNKQDLDSGFLSVRKIPKNTTNTKVKVGIENLLPLSLFEDRFYETKIEVGGYGETKTIQIFKKMAFCRWICEERQNADDFQGFFVVIEILRSFLGVEASLTSNKEESTVPDTDSGELNL